MRLSNICPLAVVLIFCLCTNVVLSYKHEEPGYWDSLRESLEGPMATIMLQHPEVKAFFGMLNTLVDKLEGLNSMDLEDVFEELLHFDFADTLSALNISLDDVFAAVDRGITLLEENPILVHIVSLHVKAHSIPTQLTFEMLFESINFKRLRCLTPDPSKAGRFHFASLRAIAEAIILFSGDNKYGMLEISNTYFGVVESFLDYLRFRAKYIQDYMELHDVEPEEVIKEVILIDILTAPQDRLNIVLSDADNIAADILALEFAADQFTGEHFARRTKEVKVVANGINELRQELDGFAYLTLEKTLDHVAEICVSIAKLYFDLEIGANALTSLQPAEFQLQFRPERRNVDHLIPLIRELAAELEQALHKYSHLYDIIELLDNVRYEADHQSIIPLYTKFRELLMDTPKFEDIVDAVDELFLSVNNIVPIFEYTHNFSDELDELNEL